MYFKENSHFFNFVIFCRIVDDSEMYDQQKPFHLDELVKISAFLNNLVFKMLWNEMENGNLLITLFRTFNALKENREL